MRNVILLICTVSVFYGFLEFAIWRNYLDKVPLTLHQSLGRLKHLAQTSKSHVVPRDYVLIVGDSYAEGLGDELMRVIDQGNPNFNAAHTVHALTGRDVISFGYRGGYPSETYVFSAYRSYFGMQLFAGLDVAPPKNLVVFYFAGNDINDEMTNIRFWLPKSFDKTKSLDESYVDKFVQQRAETGIIASRRRWHILRNAHLFDTSTKWVKMTVKNLMKGSKELLSADDPSFRAGEHYEPNWSRYENSETEIFVGGKVGKYPSHTVEPFAFHPSEDIETAALWFKSSLKQLQALFKEAKLHVIYIPSPVMAYRLVSETVTLSDRVRNAVSEIAGPLTTFSKAQITAQSQRICRAIETAATSLGAVFVDSRKFLREVAAQQGHLHGPNDPGHFNAKGYKALGTLIASAIGSTTRACGQ